MTDPVLTSCGVHWKEFHCIRYMWQINTMSHCREWQMERSFQTALFLLRPEMVFILGDVFDEGKWSSNKVRLNIDCRPQTAGSRFCCQQVPASVVYVQFLHTIVYLATTYPGPKHIFLLHILTTLEVCLQTDQLVIWDCYAIPSSVHLLPKLVCTPPYYITVI